MQVGPGMSRLASCRGEHDAQATTSAGLHWYFASTAKRSHSYGLIGADAGRRRVS